MLSPNTRSLYTAALTPPAGFVFDEALGATFSADPTILLTVPTHLALLTHKRSDATMNGIFILESMRRLAKRTTVYGQCGRIAVPKKAIPLYSLLEDIYVEVLAPRQGVFHPKFWLLKFQDPEAPGAPLYRLVVLSRNITADRCWDVCLQLEGTAGDRESAENIPLAQLIRTLPTLAKEQVSADRIAQANRLANELVQVRWELPSGFDTVAFRALGIADESWEAPRADRCAVIAPFCSDDALSTIADRGGQAISLISRPETLSDLSERTLQHFREIRVLEETAEVEDGEDVEGPDERDTHGLHAKVYLFEDGAKLRLVIGSANATHAALVAQRNVEVLVELEGDIATVGGIDKMLSDEGLGEVLTDFAGRVIPSPEELARKAAEKALDDARNLLACAKLMLNCSEKGHVWQLQLIGTLPMLKGVSSVLAWPITLSDSHAISLKATGEDAVLGEFSPISLTGLIAFELKASDFDLSLRFALNLPVQGMPEAREVALLQMVIQNQEGFIRFLLLLLGGDDSVISTIAENGADDGWTSGFTGSNGTVPLLEGLVKAYSRDRERLNEVRYLMGKLKGNGSSSDLIPQGFPELWQVFETAMETGNE